MSEQKSEEFENGSKQSINEEIERKSESELEKNKTKDEIETEKSEIEELVQSSDVGKMASVKDPLRDRKRMKILKRYVSHLCLFVMGLSLKNAFLGLFAYFFYENKTHFVVFGGLCLIQFFGSTFGWSAIKLGNRVMFMICVIINTIWIIGVIVLLLYYWLIDKSPAFNQEIALHVSAVFFIAISLFLLILCFLIIRQWNVINIEYKREEIYVKRPKH